MLIVMGFLIALEESIKKYLLPLPKYRPLHFQLH
jgi:hypothetical protein